MNTTDFLQGLKYSALCTSVCGDTRFRHVCQTCPATLKLALHNLTDAKDPVYISLSVGSQLFHEVASYAEHIKAPSGEAVIIITTA
jgi:hypothetical protein